jgi:hypothetical protein
MRRIYEELALRERHTRALGNRRSLEAVSPHEREELRWREPIALAEARSRCALREHIDHPVREIELRREPPLLRQRPQRAHEDPVQVLRDRDVRLALD